MVEKYINKMNINKEKTQLLKAIQFTSAEINLI